MRKLLTLILLMLILPITAQQKSKDYSKIIYSKDIYEIDAFLRDAHPDDPKRVVLKPRLMGLITDYLKKASPDDQSVPLLQQKLATLIKKPSTKISFDEMNANIRKKQIEYYQRKLVELEMNKYDHSSKEELVAKMERSNRELKQILSPEAYKATIEATKKDFASIETSKANPSPSKETTKGAASTPKEPAKVIPAKPAFAKPIAASPVSAPIATNTSSMMSASEAEEFKLLMNESPEEHKRKTVGLLNKLFDNDPSSKEVIVMIENKSDCDMIMRIEGVGYTKQRLPIAAHQENSIVLPKGSYLFSSVLCGAQYSSQKSLQKNIIVSLSNPK
jgi:hypothetical protein